MYQYRSLCLMSHVHLTLRSTRERGRIWILCNKDICSSVNQYPWLTLHQCSINTLVDTWSILDWHLARESVSSQPSFWSMHIESVNNRPTIDWLLIKCRPSVNLVSIGMSINQGKIFSEFTLWCSYKFIHPLQTLLFSSHTISHQLPLIAATPILHARETKFHLFKRKLLCTTFLFAIINHFG